MKMTVCIPPVGANALTERLIGLPRSTACVADPHMRSGTESRCSNQDGSSLLENESSITGGITCERQKVFIAAPMRLSFPKACIIRKSQSRYDCLAEVLKTRHE
jgi:hypothetical protein